MARGGTAHIILLVQSWPYKAVAVVKQALQTPLPHKKPRPVAGPGSDSSSTLLLLTHRLCPVGPGMHGLCPGGPIGPRKHGLCPIGPGTHGLHPVGETQTQPKSPKPLLPPPTGAG